MTNSVLPGQLTPRRITAIYLLAGFLALVFSDVVLPRFVPEPPLREAQLVKGAIEVALTGGLVYLLVTYGQRSLREANNRIQRNDEILKVLLRLLRHNIRNDMNVIQGHAENARTEADRDDVEHSCAAILATADKLLSQTETVNELRGMLEGATDIRRYELAALIEDVAAEAREHAVVDITTSIDDVTDVSVLANSLLPLALGEVVDNAIRYNDAETPHLEFSTDVSEDRVDLHIVDNGPGIPPQELLALIEREESPLAHTSGLGLWFVYWVIGDGDGEVSIENREAGGTEVIVSLRRTADSNDVVSSNPLRRPAVA